MTIGHWTRTTLLSPTALLLGCAHSPTIDIGGSFFPSWMLCLAASIGVAIATRWFLQQRSLETEIGALAIFYPGLVLLVSCLLWLLLFR